MVGSKHVQVKVQTVQGTNRLRDFLVLAFTDTPNRDKTLGVATEQKQDTVKGIETILDWHLV